ncbi:hypothetical protein EXU48_11895 [Occultella glacieicola]|uniref:Helicase XPB/Ssl2 N-terminal domain-containing protein n=1 Tax=Occultella glacieicola TaxID=2518684 RepID=A0ABY2E3D4_9MICO|nr:helicase-associated domain-containing protein [Occultella glacieicola]TDE94139.1 hypothetical protein EXU48_11895 [Occultella glacieicola]
MTTRPAAAGQSAARDPLAAALREWDDARLLALLETRPDLASPPPSSITAMIARAGSRASVGRALAHLDAPTLTVAEALVVADDAAGVTADRLAGLLGLIGPDVTGYLQHLLDLALATGDLDGARAVPALAEAIGPHPLGLGPSLGDLPVNLADGWPTTARALAAVLAKAPPGPVRMLEALTWGPPLGTVTHDIPPAARWLLDAHVLYRIAPTQLVLPREVALAARGGRLVRELRTEPPLPEATARPPATIGAETVRVAEEAMHAVGLVLDAWANDPPAVLRSGGLGVRDLRQVAGALEASSTRAAFVVELAGMLGLLGHVHDSDGSVWAPVAEAEDWREEPVPARWARTVRAWLASPRTPWLAGTRTDKGVLRSALEPDLERAWAAPLRRRVLESVRAWPEHAAPDAAAVHAHVAWHTARAAPPLSAVQAILDEAAALGLTGAGALGAPARLLLDGATEDQLARAFARDLPPSVDEIFVQGDLSGIVPGRPGAGLAALLAASADVESRGAALTVRFTPTSIRRALDSGLTAESLTGRLREVSRTPLPQPLEYLIADTARTHGQVRVGSARAFLRSDDARALTAVLADSRLAHLGLRLIAPTVLAAQASAHDVADALRAAGTAPLLEGADGELLVLSSQRVRAARPVSGPATPSPTAVPLAEVVAGMHAGEERARRLLSERAAQPDLTDPGRSVELLRAAAAHGTDVDLVMAGPSGRTERRRVRPMSVDGGRVRVRDLSRDSEITVAVHRIAAVRPVGPAAPSGPAAPTSN